MRIYNFCEFVKMKIKEFAILKKSVIMVIRGEFMPINKSKFSNFFVCLLIPMALIMFVGMFFSVKIVGNTYFVALILAIVFLILNKKYGKFITNHKLAFILFETINLIAIIAVIYYEFTKFTIVLNIFLIILLVVELLLLILDIFYIKNDKINAQENLFISIVKVGSFICILTYFFKVSTLFFAIDALIFELANIVLKILFKKFDIPEFEKVVEEKEISNIEKIIDSAAENEGEIE